MTTRFHQPFGAAPPALAEPATVGIRSIEVVQSVQDKDGSVPLLAGKATVVRVFPDASTLTAKIRVRCELAWRREGGEHYLPVVGAVELDPAAPNNLEGQRLSLDGSFTVRLPVQALAEGKLDLRVATMRRAGGGELAVKGKTATTVTFDKSPVLRIRAVGLRYKAGNTSYAPEALHFDYLRSYLGRAYPVAQVEWSQIVVDASFSAPFNSGTPLRANAQLAAMRSREVSNGVDPRTHYYGLVSDAGGAHFMRGRASDIPGQPAPDVVASGPVGTPRGFAGDNDDSYADWYGAHELGHTFGRYHPGFPPGQQDASDPTFPYPDGQLSGPADGLVGFDIGDPALSLPMQVLAGTNHHDIMTYADRQWVSAYTFRTILDRLRLEHELA